MDRHAVNTMSFLLVALIALFFIVLPLTVSTSQLPCVPSGMILKVNGAALGLASSSKPVT